jgi:hypothetical protein
MMMKAPSEKHHQRKEKPFFLSTPHPSGWGLERHAGNIKRRRVGAFQFYGTRQLFSDCYTPV